MRTIEEIKSDYRSAIFTDDMEKLRELVIELKGINSLEAIALVHFIHGVIDEFRAHLHEALQHYLRALELSKELNNDRLNSTILLHIGNVYTTTSKYPLALDFYARALAVGEADNNEEIVATTLMNIALVHSGLGNYGKARNELKRALKLQEKVGSPINIVKTLLATGDASSKVGKYDEARRCIDRALKLSEEHGLKVGMGLSRYYQGALLHTNGRLADAFRAQKLAHNYFDELDMREFVGEALRAMGEIHLLTGSLIEAYDCFNRAHTYFAEIGYPQGILRVNVSLAGLYSEIRNYSESLRCLDRALEISKDTGAEFSRANVLHEMSKKCRRAGQLDTSLGYAREALVLYEQLGMPDSMSEAALALGNVLTDLGSSREAREALDIVVKLKSEIPGIRIGRYRLESMLYQSDGEFKLAQDLCMQALEVADSNGLSLESAELHKSLRELAFENADLLSYRKHNEAYLKQTEDIARGNVMVKIAIGQIEHELTATQHNLMREKSRREKAEQELIRVVVENAARMEFVESLKTYVGSMLEGKQNGVDTAVRLKRKLDDLPNYNLGWTKFEGQFLSVHPDFVSELFNKHPSLTKQEIKVCQLALLGVKIHEMSSILVVSDRSVESHRYNIRRKFGIPSDASLTEFLKRI